LNSKKKGGRFALRIVGNFNGLSKEGELLHRLPTKVIE